MRERPILFSAPMIRAILADTKTQTRRPLYVLSRADRARFDQRFPPNYGNGEWPNVPPGHGWTLSRWYRVDVGDRLWIREAWRAPIAYELTPPRDIPADTPIVYQADGAGSLPHFNAGKLRPGMFMPRWASRITLEVTAVRIQRLQAISKEDALAEGIVPTHGGYGLPDGSHFHAADPRVSYWSLWDAINGAGSVEQDPWVWAGSFRRLPAN